MATVNSVFRYSKQDQNLNCQFLKSREEKTVANQSTSTISTGPMVVLPAVANFPNVDCKAQCHGSQWYSEYEFPAKLQRPNRSSMLLSLC